MEQGPIEVISKNRDPGADLTLTELETLAADAENQAAELLGKLAERRVEEAVRLRDEALELRNKAAELEGRAHELHPQEEAIKYEPEEPEVLREARANGGRVAQPERKKKKAAKRASRKAQRKMATVHQSRRGKAGKKGPGRPKGSKPQPPTMAEVVAVVKKGKGLTAAQIAERHGWDPRRVSQRLGAAARKGLVENRGEGRDGVWFPVKGA